MRPPPGDEWEEVATVAAERPVSRAPRPKQWEEVATVNIQATRKGKFDKPRVPRDPMQALLAAHVYGEAEIDTRLLISAPGVRSRRFRGIFWGAVVFILAGLSLAVADHIAAGRRAEEVRRQLVVLDELLLDGSLGPAADLRALLHDVQGKQERAVLETEPAKKALQAADALLYRLWDADQERGRALAADSELPPWIQLLLQPRRARSPTLRRLALPPVDASSEAELWQYYLRASAASAVHQNAEDAFEEALDVAPTNLPVLAELVELHVREGRAAKATEVADEIRDIAPESPWVEVVWSRVDDKAGPPIPAPDASLPAVLRAQVWAYRAMERNRSGASAEAVEAAREAANAVGGQAPFIVDLADVLLAANEPALARILVDQPGWPKDPVADGLKGRLLTLESMDAPALKLLTQSFESTQDPDVGQALVKLLSAPGAPKDELPRIRATLRAMGQAEATSPDEETRRRKRKARKKRKRRARRRR